MILINHEYEDGQPRTACMDELGIPRYISLDQLAVSRILDGTPQRINHQLS